MHRLSVSVFSMLLLAACGRGGEPAGDDRDRALASVTGAGVRGHMEALATDAMRGREAGTDDYQRAADYVVARFREAGLEPLGEGDSYFQWIEFRETRLVPDSARMTLTRGGESIELVFRDDFIRDGGYGDADETLTAPLVFAGHGIVAPEFGHDDYAGVDAAGRIVILLSGAPPHFDTDRRAYYSSGSGKAREAVSRGAVGIVTVRTPVDQARRAWERYLPGIGSPGMRWLDERGEPFEGYPELAGSALLSQPGAEKLFALAGQDLAAIFDKHAAGGTGSFELGVDAMLARASAQRSVSSANVIGVIRGSDPDLRDEYVVYTAHLDHIGVRPGKEGDDIHNGAYDNSAGIGVILEIAAAMGALQTPPRRSVIFAAVTAEEKGLQGSSYLAKNPPVPVASLVANINIDMPYLGFPVNDIQAFGAEHSSLYDAVSAATAAMGMGLTPDPLPQEVRFIRSDQFSFVKEGIPALAFKAGTHSSDPELDGDAMLDDFLKNHYHLPSDDLSLPYSAEGAERFTRAGLLLGLIVADADARPAWNAGDFFGDKFAPGP